MGMRRDQAERLEEALRKNMRESYELLSLLEAFEIKTEFTGQVDKFHDKCLLELHEIIKMYNQD